MNARLPRTQQQRRAETEQRLLEAALSLIAESGSRAVSTARVGAVAGYSRGIVRHQFGTKKELLRRAVEHAQILVTVPPEATGLQWILELTARYLELPPDGVAGVTRAFLLMWGEAAANDVNVREVYVERDQWFRDLIATAVTDGIAAGDISETVDPYAFAFLLVGLLRGTVMQLILSPEPAAHHRLRSECLAMVGHHLTGRAG